MNIEHEQLSFSNVWTIDLIEEFSLKLFYDWSFPRHNWLRHGSIVIMEGIRAKGVDDPVCPFFKVRKRGLSSSSLTLRSWNFQLNLCLLGNDCALLHADPSKDSSNEKLLKDPVPAKDTAPLVEQRPVVPMPLGKAKDPSCNPPSDVPQIGSIESTKRLPIRTRNIPLPRPKPLPPKEPELKIQPDPNFEPDSVDTKIFPPSKSLSEFHELAFKKVIAKPNPPMESCAKPEPKVVKSIAKEISAGIEINNNQKICADMQPRIHSGTGAIKKVLKVTEDKSSTKPSEKTKTPVSSASVRKQHWTLSKIEQHIAKNLCVSDKKSSSKMTPEYVEHLMKNRYESKLSKKHEENSELDNPKIDFQPRNESQSKMDAAPPREMQFLRRPGDRLTGNIQKYEMQKSGAELERDPRPNILPLLLPKDDPMTSNISTKESSRPGDRLTGSIQNHALPIHLSSQMINAHSMTKPGVNATK